MLGDSELTPREMRGAFLRLARTVGAMDASVGRISDLVLPRIGVPLPVRVHIPAANMTDKSAALLYSHGGAGVFCSIDTHDGHCRTFANGSGCRIISVDYRLAPEHRFPAAVEDAYFAANWVSEHALELKIDPKRIAVGGDSFGATLAAVVCQLARQKRSPLLALQTLFRRVTDMVSVTDSRKAYARHYFLERSTIDSE